MKKEVVCYVSTDEEGETVQVRRVMGKEDMYLFSLGQNRMVLKLSELIEAVETIEQYSEVFNTQEKIRAQMIQTVAAKTVPVEQPKVEEIVFEVGSSKPTESEKQMFNLFGDSGG